MALTVGPGAWEGGSLEIGSIDRADVRSELIDRSDGCLKERSVLEERRGAMIPVFWF